MSNKFIVIVPVYNAEKYIERCLWSILSQKYDDYKLVVIDDCSTDSTYEIINKSNDANENNFSVCKNHYRVGSPLANVAKCIDLFAHNKEDIIVTVDGDDFLYSDDVLSCLNTVYQDKYIYMTYGQFIPLSGSYGKFCKPIPDTKLYRKSGEWLASHLRTFKKKLWVQIKEEDLRQEDGNYYVVAGDAAYMYPLIEMCGTEHCKFIDEILYVYNDLSPDNEMKKYREVHIQMVTEIRNKSVYGSLTGII